jgi:hypothetical protein
MSVAGAMARFNVPGGRFGGRFGGFTITPLLSTYKRRLPLLISFNNIQGARATPHLRIRASPHGLRP